MNKLKKLIVVGSLASLTGGASAIALRSAMAKNTLIQDLQQTILKSRTEDNSQTKSQTSLTTLINEAAQRHGIDKRIVAAIVKRESGGKRDAIRFEPGQMSRAAKFTKNVEQQRMLASSHGLTQVMGWWAPEFGISWVDLHDPRTNLDVGCRILRKGLDRHAGKPKAERLRRALHEYNGSSKYAEEVLSAIAEEVIETSVTL